MAKAKPMEAREKSPSMVKRKAAAGISRPGSLLEGCYGPEILIPRQLRLLVVDRGAGKDMVQVLPRLLAGCGRFGRGIGRGRHWTKDCPTCRWVSTSGVVVIGPASRDGALPIKVTGTDGVRISRHI